MSQSVVGRVAGCPAAVLVAVLVTAGCAGGTADAQVVYYGAMRPIVAAPVVAGPAYVANYFPSGNYAAVTAFSPPMVAAPAEVAVRTAYSPVFAAPVAAPVAVTSYYAPVAAPTVAYYAPPVAAPVFAAPVTAAYAPAAVAVPLYRRGLFGGLRPVRSAYLIPY
jgi:hypothetical protein